MVLVFAPERLEAGDPVADVDALHEMEVGERVERPVDAGDADGPARRDDAVVDFLGGAAAVCSSRESTTARRAPPRRRPASRSAVNALPGPAHAVDDIDSHRLLASRRCFRESFSCVPSMA